jgi:hypothetical protein
LLEGITLFLILVITKNDKQKLNENIYRLKMAPILHSNMQKALNNVKHTHLSAVVIDAHFKDIDILELILNVRDLRPELPVIVVGISPKDPLRSVILDIPETHLLAACDRHFDHTLKTLAN